MCAPEHISLVISVPRTIYHGSGVSPACKTSVVIPSANGMHVRTILPANDGSMGRKGGVTRFPSSEHLKDLGGGPIPGVFQVCEHEGVSSSSRYMLAKKTIADLLQTDHSLHEHSDSGGW